ncbi:hypothetical protein KSX_81610 [Ktedonospora formicarum]|uniref:Uncharacterized protein n=1 Tax=Ktedonospora formicarum TaxID=2778364 RepID=A0A8J3ID00_9CHLR|nr:hypothetical protein KSX_81610 [Ktedonospora formicarum]
MRVEQKWTTCAGQKGDQVALRVYIAFESEVREGLGEVGAHLFLMSRSARDAYKRAKRLVELIRVHGASLSRCMYNNMALWSYAKTNPHTRARRRYHGKRALDFARRMHLYYATL